MKGQEGAARVFHIL